MGTGTNIGAPVTAQIDTFLWRHSRPATLSSRSVETLLFRCRGTRTRCWLRSGSCRGGSGGAARRVSAPGNAVGFFVGGTPDAPFAHAFALGDGGMATVFTALDWRTGAATTIVSTAVVVAAAIVWWRWVNALGKPNAPRSVSCSWAPSAALVQAALLSDAHEATVKLLRVRARAVDALADWARGKVLALVGAGELADLGVQSRVDHHVLGASFNLNACKTSSIDIKSLSASFNVRNSQVAVFARGQSCLNAPIHCPAIVVNGKESLAPAKGHLRGAIVPPVFVPCGASFLP